MSAPAAIRGFNFQTAYAVRAAFEVLADPSVSAIRVEGVDDAVDVETIGSDGVPLRLTQVKSRDSGAPWGKAAVFAACERLTHPSSDATLVFFTDAPFGPELRNKILPAIAAVVAETADESDLAILQQADLGAFGPEILARLDLQDNQPRVEVQLALAEADVRSLIELHEPCNATRARAAIDALFRLLGLRAGERQDTERVVQRADLAAVLAVPLESIDAAGRWDEAARAAYVNDVDKDPMRAPAILATDLAIGEAVELGVEGITRGVLRSADGDQTSPQTVTDLLRFRLVGLVSPAGGGKSTSIGLLAHVAARNGSLPIVLAAVDLVGSSIEREAARSAQIRVGRTFAPGTGATRFAVWLQDQLPAGGDAPDAREAVHRP